MIAVSECQSGEDPGQDGLEQVAVREGVAEGVGEKGWEIRGGGRVP